MRWSRFKDKESREIFLTMQQRVVAVAALQNHQRLRGQLPRGQVRDVYKRQTCA